jgi:hypothetical protein
MVSIFKNEERQVRALNQFLIKDGRPKEMPHTLKYPGHLSLEVARVKNFRCKF